MTGGTAEDVFVETRGNFTLKSGGTFFGTIFAPQGNVVLEGNTTLTGAAYANTSSPGGSVSLSSGADVIFDLADYFSADLAVEKTVSDSTPSEGDEITFTITVTNDGPFGAPGVEITDLVPAGLSFLSSDTVVGTYSSGSGVWTIGTLANGASASLDITVTVDAGTAGTTIYNTASVTASGMADSDNSNNSATVEINVESGGGGGGIKEPGFAFVDVDNDQLFTAGTDVEIATSLLADGFFDTAVSEGSYTAILGAGLVITGVGPFANTSGFTFISDGTLVLNTNVTSTSNGSKIKLTSRGGSVLLDDPFVTGRSGVAIVAAGDIIATDGDALKSTANGSKVTLDAGGKIDVTGSTLEGRSGVHLTSTGAEILAGGADTLLKSTANGSKVLLAAGTWIDVAEGILEGRSGVQLIAGADNDIDATAAVLTSTANGSKVKLDAGDAIHVTGATIVGRSGVHLTAGGEIDAASAELKSTANGSKVLLSAGTSINVTSGKLFSRSGTELTSGPGHAINAEHAMITSTANGSQVVMTAGTDINADHSNFYGRSGVQLTAGQDIFARFVDMSSTANGSKVKLKAGRDIDVSDSSLYGRSGIVLEAADDIFAKGTLFETTANNSRVELTAGDELDIAGAIINSVLAEILTAVTIIGP